MLLAGFDQLWQPAEAAHVALVARRHALAPLAPPQPQPQPEEASPPFSLYNEEAFIQGEDPCFGLVQQAGGGAGERVSEGGGAAGAVPCAYASADGAGAGFFILKVRVRVRVRVGVRVGVRVRVRVKVRVRVRVRV